MPNKSRSTKVSTNSYTWSKKKLVEHPADHTGLVCERAGTSNGQVWPDTSLVLSSKAHDKFQKELRQLESKFAGSDLIRQGAALIIQGLKEDCGVDTDDENFQDTPNRVARLYMELFAINRDRDEKINEILSKAFPGSYEEMVLVKDISATSMCPHHLLIVDYKISLAYIPRKNGKVLGLSKLSRLAQLIAAKPALQEQTTFDIVTTLHNTLKARGAICFIEGKHSCVSARGVKDREAVTVTSAVRGIFRETGEKSREEFFAAINRPK